MPTSNTSPIRQWIRRGTGRYFLALLLFTGFLLPGIESVTEVDSCLMKVLVLLVDETPSDSYWTGAEAKMLNEATRWFLDLYGMSYDEINPPDLSKDILYDQDGLAYSVVVDNGNRLGSAQRELLLGAVAGDGLGLVTHTASATYISETLGITEVPSMGWKDHTAWGEFSIHDANHYITRLCHAPIEQITHNLVVHDKPDYSFIHRVDLTAQEEEGTILAWTQESPWYPRIAPEVIAKEVGMGRVVWFARPFHIYNRASYFMVERDHVMSFLPGRAIEWASTNSVMVSKWLYPHGHWCAHAIIMDGYYDYPPPGYGEPVTPPGSLDEIIWEYGAIEKYLEDLGLRFTATIVFRNNATTGWDAGYDLTSWDTGIQSLRWLVQNDNELALGAYDYLNYDELTKSAESWERAVTNLVKGREAMYSLLGVEDPIYIFYLVPDEIITGNSLYELVADARFETMVGGVYKTDFPYDLYGSIYPYYLSTGEGDDTHLVVVLENSFFINSITGETDFFYVDDVYKRHGTLILRIPPWQIQDHEDILHLLKQHIDLTSKENVWWTTVEEIGRYTHQRLNVDVRARAYSSGNQIQISIQNNNRERVEGFSVKVKLEDNSATTQIPTTNMEVESIVQDGRDITGENAWTLEDIGEYPASLLVWTDLEPGETTQLEIRLRGGRAQIHETAFATIIIAILVLEKWERRK